MAHNLHLNIDGRILRPALAAPGWFAFRLPPRPRRIRLRADAVWPAARPGHADPRRLGFALRSLTLAAAGLTRDIPLAALADGAYPAESGGWRWTDGDAALPDDCVADLHEGALLIVRGFAPDGPGTATTHRAIHLAGDSWPEDGHIENHLFRALHPFLAAGLVRQADMVPPHLGGRHERDIAARLARLEAPAAARTDDDAGRLVLVGRSSGARIATLFAAQHPGTVAAVICLGYPFRPPTGPAEPDRTAHLATLATPTLVIQGEHDPYGGANTLGNTPLSEKILLRTAPGGHEFHLDAAQWNAVAREVLVFLATQAPG